MFATSDRYKEVIRDTSEQYLMGIITASDGTVIEINDSVISSGSASITKQTLVGQEFSFGGAIMGELDISIRTDVSRYLLYDATLDLWCRVVVDGETEYIPMGIWVIAEAERDKKALKMTAYDTLIKLNKKYDLALEGTPYNLMNSFALECGVELAQDEDYYLSLTNGDQYITINRDTGCANFRDAAGVIAQMCGCFVESDRYGRISMRPFHTVPDFSLSKSQRYSSTISDFVCHYIEVEAIGQAGTYISVDEEGGEDVVGMKMLFDDAPAWDYGLPENLQQKTDNLRLLLEQIYYTPCELSIPSDPSIDCGDMVMLYSDEGDVNSIITSYTWNYRGTMELTSSGVNPHLQTIDATKSRQIRNLKQEIDAAKVVYYPFMNTARIRLTETMQKVVSVPFTSIADTSIIFQGTMQVDVTVPDIEVEQTLSFTVGDTAVTVPIKIPMRDFARIHIRYGYDNAFQRIEYIDSVCDGGHIISLHYPVNKIEIDTTHTFEVWMSVENGSAVLDTGMFVGAISGQGLAAVSQWNGQLELEDYIETFSVGRNFMRTRAMRDVGPVFEPNTNGSDFTFREHFARIDIHRPISIRTITESIGDNLFDIIIKQQTVTFGSADNKYIEVLSSGTELRTKYMFEGEPVELDSGNAVSAHVRTDDFKLLEGVVVYGDD